MSFLSKWFGPKYDDARLEAHAREAIDVDPLVSDAATLVVASNKGVVTLGGPVKDVKEKDRIEGVVREALRSSGLKYASIMNDLKTSNGAG
jgi:osmotically-inducible protein OsmY